MPKKKQIVTNKVKAMPKKPVIQQHHITYEPERTVLIYKGEHYILTQLQWRRYISKGLIEALKQFIKDYKHLAYPLRKPKKKVVKKKKVAKKKNTSSKKTTKKKTRRKRGVKRPTRKTR